MSNMKLLLGLLTVGFVVHGADYPAPVESDWAVKDFRFHTGEVLPELRMHYRTIGSASGQPVLLLHGTGGSGAGFLNDAFAGELFGPGQPLDAATHFLILPDAIGAGKSSRPSDGMRMKFPKYNYDDMVVSQYRLVTEHLGLRHLRAVLGISGGGMQTWIFGEMYPDFIDALVPMASMPVEMSGRNWMLRRMLTESIRTDPEWNGGNYSQQPRGLQLAQVYFGIATAGGTQALYKQAPTRAKADEEVDRRLAARGGADANDVIYQFESSRDYNPSPKLDAIRAHVLAINSADDERNPPELGVMDRETKRIKQSRYVLIPAGPDTRGHGTVNLAKLWKQYLVELLAMPTLEAAR